MWLRMCVAFFIASIVCGNLEIVKSNEEWLEVNIAQGPVRGRKDQTKDLFVFYNIPYATEPVNENKFKAPLPPPVWSKPFDAIKDHVICPQGKIQLDLTSQNSATENCLIANIYVPNTKEKNLSVLVYVHGGAFVMGYGEMFQATELMKNKDLIVVTFNYRLGIHGFLCLGTDDIPGNAGMKDQLALLRWVQKNIASFGGNPQDVTLAGYSAGSSSVDLIMLSKQAEGLFHRVIPESGGNLAAFAVQSNPLEIAKNHAKKLNFTNVDDIYALENFYKTASMELLTSDLFMDRTDATFMFSPCVERDTGDGAFLTESPLDILRNGNFRKLPVLYGFANMEGLLRIDFFEIWKDKMNEKFSNFLPANLKFETEEEKEKVANMIKNFYFGDKPVNNENILGYVDYHSDVFFNFPMLWAAKLHAEAGNNEIYLYEYSFTDKNTPVVPHTNIRGANHCSQTIAVMDRSFLSLVDESKETPEYKDMVKVMRQIWYNFIKTGIPVPSGSSLPAWPAAGADRSPYMSLGQKIELRGILLEERTRFWDEIYQKYYWTPIPPPIPPPKHMEL